MDDLGLDDMVAEANSKKEEAKKNKNALPQLLKKLRKNDPSVTKVVVRDDPVAKTGETICRALVKNTHVEILNLKNVKMTIKAAKYLAKALAVNTTLHTLVLYCEISSDGVNDIVQALAGNTTVGKLTLWNGITNDKYWESWVEPNLKKYLCDPDEGNKSIINLHVGPIRGKSYKEAIERQAHVTRTYLQKKHEEAIKGGDAAADEEDDWMKLASKYDYLDDDSYEYVYDETYGKSTVEADLE